jgi:molybdate transport system substrate-binding protein
MAGARQWRARIEHTSHRRIGMKRFSLWLAVAFIGVVLTAGCAGPVTSMANPLEEATSAAQMAPTAARASAPPTAKKAAGQELTVFAAASLSESFGELGRRFEAAHPGVKVLLNFAGSQQLRAQLEEGAQADVFASANTKEMNAAIASGLVVSGTQKVFARNRLTAIVPAANPDRVSALADLARPGLKLVLADKAVPVGQYTLDMLDKMSRDPAFGGDFPERVQANVVSREDNVKSVVAKVRLGEADAGIVYSTDAAGAAAKDLMLLPVPDEFNQIATYPLAVLAKAPQAELARRFAEFVLSKEGQQTMSRFGFIPPESK